jgi:mevalonate kinase
MKDLSNSIIDRKNVLNNNTAVKEIYNQLGFVGIEFDKKTRYTLNQVAKFYETDTRTIERIIEEHIEELQLSGYEIFKGSKLKSFKDTVNQLTDTDVGQLMQDNDNELVGKRAASLAVFTFKAVLNVGCFYRFQKRQK